MTAVTDEAAGRSAAEADGIEIRRTASRYTGRETIDAITECGWYVAPDRYTTIVKKPELFD